uniref:Uncharacterized protein n=1 Tax=Oryza nivara TaxID=4536 RepID=A0A0E0HH77_ORYNI
MNVPATLRSEGFCSTRGCLVVLETLSLCCRSCLPFGKLGNDDFCEVSLVVSFLFYIGFCRFPV